MATKHRCEPQTSVSQQLDQLSQQRSTLLSAAYAMGFSMLAIRKIPEPSHVYLQVKIYINLLVNNLSLPKLRITLKEQEGF